MSGQEIPEAPAQVCGWWVGPVWKADGETCVCKLQPEHDGGHECTCGSWFDGCGHPPDFKRSEP